MAPLLLLALLCAPIPDDAADPARVQPAAPVPEAGTALRGERRSPWGLTLGVGADAPLDARSGPGLAVWAGARRWVAPHLIVSGLASYQQFAFSDAQTYRARVQAFAAVARIEMASERDRWPFPIFSLYLGAGPELLVTPWSRGMGARAVVGLHLPSLARLWSGYFASNDLGMLFVVLAPLALELQFRTGAAGVPPSTGLVIAFAI
jgi:hypothetical protein